jgi:hypothetical protein
VCILIFDPLLSTCGGALFERVTATVFHRFLQTGRTSPAIFSCLPDSDDEECEFVVKLKGGPELLPSSLACEAIASELADYFDLKHPQQAIAQLDEPLADVVAQQEVSKAELLRASVGKNFGTALLNNLVTWPVDRKLSASQLQSAFEIFAFDVLIQNPDRRFNNPNLGSVGDHLVIYDHELAFSFRFDIFPSPQPWKIGEQRFWNEHVLFNALKHQPFELDSFIEKLSVLPVSLLDAIEHQIPEDWVGDIFPAVRNHLMAISSHADEFRDEIVRRLI